MNGVNYETYMAQYNLKRFVDAHRQDYETALTEIRGGRKRSHWMWYIFPQLRGLGYSPTANYYGIVDWDEAMMFLQHPQLGRNLYAITEELLAIDNKPIEEILGDIDALKFRSSMTLFDAVYPNAVFAQALRKYYDGEADQRTLRMLQEGMAERERWVPGGIIGAIIGDIVGSVYEFYNFKSTDIALFTQRTQFTDDTVMTMAVADWLLNGGALEETMPHWGKAYPNRGYGGMFRRWLFYSAERQPYNSFGNGAGMRVSPCGYYGQSMEEVLELAKLSAEVTHNHPEGIKGAQAIAAAIYLARRHPSKEEIRTYIEETFGYDLHRTCDDIRPHYQFDVSCQGSCPEAIIAFLDSSSYLSAIRLAVSLGGDSDTIACMTGGIAAAFYGIPTWIVKYVVTEYLPQPMRDVMQRFDEVCAERNQE